MFTNHESLECLLFTEVWKQAQKPRHSSIQFLKYIYAIDLEGFLVWDGPICDFLKICLWNKKNNQELRAHTRLTFNKPYCKPANVMEQKLRRKMRYLLFWELYINMEWFNWTRNDY